MRARKPHARSRADLIAQGNEADNIIRLNWVEARLRWMRLTIASSKSGRVEPSARKRCDRPDTERARERIWRGEGRRCKGIVRRRGQRRVPKRSKSEAQRGSERSTRQIRIRCRERRAGRECRAREGAESKRGAERGARQEWIARGKRRARCKSGTGQHGRRQCERVECEWVGDAVCAAERGRQRAVDGRGRSRRDGQCTTNPTAAHFFPIKRLPLHFKPFLCHLMLCSASSEKTLRPRFTCYKKRIMKRTLELCRDVRRLRAAIHRRDAAAVREMLARDPTADLRTEFAIDCYALGATEFFKRHLGEPLSLLDAMIGAAHGGQESLLEKLQRDTQDDEFGFSCFSTACGPVAERGGHIRLANFLMKDADSARSLGDYYRSRQYLAACSAGNEERMAQLSAYVPTPHRRIEGINLLRETVRTQRRRWRTALRHDCGLPIAPPSMLLCADTPMWRGTAHAPYPSYCPVHA